MSEKTGSRPRYSLVVPVFNEQAVLPMLLLRLERLLQELDGAAEAIFVDDGSSDCSAIVLRQKAKDDPRLQSLAGLAQARADDVLSSLRTRMGSDAPH